MTAGKPDIKPEILIEDLIGAYPDAVTILMDEGIRCLVCGEPVWGTLAEVMQSKNLSIEEQQRLVRRLRQDMA